MKLKEKIDELLLKYPEARKEIEQFENENKENLEIDTEDFSLKIIRKIAAPVDYFKSAFSCNNLYAAITPFKITHLKDLVNAEFNLTCEDLVKKLKEIPYIGDYSRREFIEAIEEYLFKGFPTHEWKWNTDKILIDLFQKLKLNFDNEFILKFYNEFLIKFKDELTQKINKEEEKLQEDLREMDRIHPF